jgi:hypothetical protein
MMSLSEFSVPLLPNTLYRPEIEGLLANGATQRFIAARYKTTEANLHHWLKKHGIKRPKGTVLA